ncbi:hypothetical protein JOD21_000569 [Jeotgalibacillus terrae]|nr:hypothetical protein [Jeotgalibacillus terrae]
MSGSPAGAGLFVLGLGGVELGGCGGAATFPVTFMVLQVTFRYIQVGSKYLEVTSNDNPHFRVT